MCFEQKTFELFFRVLILSSTVFASGGCDEDDPVELPPKYLVPHGDESFYVEAQDGDIVRTISALVIAADSTPKAGVTVFFKAVSGKATLSESSALTNSDGIASIAVSVPSELGIVTVQAEAFSLTGSPIRYAFHIHASSPFSIDMISGNYQEATATKRLPNPFKVKVTDEFGNPVAQAGVAFRIERGGGELHSSEVRQTDSEGTVSVEYTTGANEPINIVKASIGTLSVDFTAYTVIPVALETAAGKEDHVSLTWSKTGLPTFSSYTIQRSVTFATNFETIAEFTDSDVNTFTDYTVLIGQQYRYYVRVNTTNGNYSNSKEKIAEAGQYIDLINELHIRDIIINNERSTLYVSDPRDKIIRIISTSPFEKTDSIMLSDVPGRMSLSADDTKLYITSGTGAFTIIDVASKTELETIDISAWLKTSISDIYPTGDGQLFACDRSGYIVKLDPADGYSAQPIVDDVGIVTFSGRASFVGDHNNYLYVEEDDEGVGTMVQVDISSDSATLVYRSTNGPMYVNGTEHSVLSKDGESIYTSIGQVLNTENFRVDGLIQPYTESIQLSETSNNIFASYNSGNQQGRLAVLNRSTLLPEKQMTFAFVCKRIFLSEDETKMFLLAIDDIRDTCKLFKVNAP